MKNYKCEICGKKHNVYYSVRCPEPSYLHNLSEEEREKRVEGVGSLLLFNKDFFLVKGKIFIEVKDISEWMCFEVWARIEIEDFQKKLEEVRKDIFDKPLVGRLEDEIPYYENVKNLKMDVVLPNKDEVVFEILEENHPMMIDQKNGISKEKLISWMQIMNHSKSIKKNSKKESFQVSFNKIIQKAKTEYFSLQKLFIIDVLEERNVMFQILSPTVLNSTKTEKGFVIYLPFDTSGEEAKDELERFKKTTYFKKFEYDCFDRMPTYFLILEDEKELKNYSKQIIQEVYRREIKEVEFDIFEP